MKKIVRTAAMIALMFVTTTSIANEEKLSLITKTDAKSLIYELDSTSGATKIELIDADNNVIYFENIEKLEGVRAINWSFGTSVDPAELIKRFSGKYLLIPHIDRGVHLEEGISNLNKGIHSEYDLTKYLLDNMEENSSLYIWFQPDLCRDVQQMKRIYSLMVERGFAPRGS